MTMGTNARIAAGLALVALVAGCDKGKEKPSGQVVATVNGEDITIHELNSELALARAPADVPRKTVESVVLARVIERKMLADVARTRDLDKNPQFLLAQRRLDEGLLVQALQGDIAKKVPPATREAAEKYIEAHPDQFKDRKIYQLDQIQFLRPANIATLGFEAAKTLADVSQLLTTNKIEFRRNTAGIDTLTVAPALVAEIGRILTKNPDEVFMFADQPQGAPAPVMYVNKVIGSKVQPFTGEPAIALAQQILQREAVQASLVNNLKTFKAAATPKITYAAGYGPPPAQKTALAPAPTNGAPTTPAPTTPAPTTPAPAAAPAS